MKARRAGVPGLEHLLPAVAVFIEQMLEPGFHGECLLTPGAAALKEAAARGVSRAQNRGDEFRDVSLGASRRWVAGSRLRSADQKAEDSS